MLLRGRVLFVVIPAMLVFTACNSEYGKNKSPAPSGKSVFSDLSYDDALAKAKKENKLVMIEFSGPN